MAAHNCPVMKSRKISSLEFHEDHCNQNGEGSEEGTQNQNEIKIDVQALKISELLAMTMVF